MENAKETIQQIEDSLDKKKNDEKPQNFINLDDYPDHLVSYWMLLEKGLGEAINFNVPLNKPDWLDMEKFKRGQKFARDHYFSIQYVTLTALCLSYTEPYFIKGFIMTGRSNTPFKAFKKFLTTSMVFTSWYDEDVWSDERTSGKMKLDRARKLHKYVQQKFEEYSEEEFNEKTYLGDVDEMAARMPLHMIIKQDYKNFCKNSAMYKKHGEINQNVMLSQSALAGAQLGVMGLAVTYPRHFGLYNVSEEELESFAHFWRGMGYLLGVGDEYNFANADLDTIRLRTRETINLFFKPAIGDVHVHWEHMIRCMVDGIQLCMPVAIFSFESLVYDISRMIGVPTPGLEKWMSYRQYLSFLMTRLTMTLQRIPCVVALSNWWLRYVIKKAENASAEVLAKWKAKKFSYVINENQTDEMKNFD